jgi:hypothetical protein
MEYYKEVNPLGHWDCNPAFNYTYESLFYEARVIFRCAKTNKGSRRLQRGIQKDFARKNDNQQMFRHGRLKNGGRTIRRILIDRHKREKH